MCGGKSLDKTGCIPGIKSMKKIVYRLVVYVKLNKDIIIIIIIISRSPRYLCKVN